jgi:hypothetical protein
LGFDHFQGVEGRGVGGGGLLVVGCEEGVKDYIGKDGLVVIQVVFGYVLGMNVTSFNHVQVGSFLVIFIPASSCQ